MHGTLGPNMIVQGRSHNPSTLHGTQSNSMSLDLIQLQQRGAHNLQAMDSAKNMTTNQSPMNLQEINSKSYNIHRTASLQREANHGHSRRAKNPVQKLSINGNNIVFQYNQQQQPTSDNLQQHNALPTNLHGHVTSTSLV